MTCKELPIRIAADISAETSRPEDIGMIYVKC